MTNPADTMTGVQVIPTNTRAACAVAMKAAAHEEPWFGIEQEYTLMNSTTHRPLGMLPFPPPFPPGPHPHSCPQQWALVSLLVGSLITMTGMRAGVISASSLA